MQYEIDQTYGPNFALREKQVYTLANELRLNSSDRRRIQEHISFLTTGGKDGHQALLDVYRDMLRAKHSVQLETGVKAGRAVLKQNPKTPPQMQIFDENGKKITIKLAPPVSVDKVGEVGYETEEAAGIQKIVPAYRADSNNTRVENLNTIESHLRQGYHVMQHRTAKFSPGKVHSRRPSYFLTS